jgi:hypothetical protein
MTDGELNAALGELADKGDDYAPVELRGGKAIPYYGWFWRNVDFSRPLWLAYANGVGRDVPAWVGFCENNKWGYEEFQISSEATLAVRELCEAFVAAPSKNTARDVFEYLQTLKPEHVTGAQRWEDSE